MKLNLVGSRSPAHLKAPRVKVTLSHFTLIKPHHLHLKVCNYIEVSPLLEIQLFHEETFRDNNI